ncbi:unnamed protein product [Arctogadus glacialis]
MVPTVHSSDEIDIQQGCTQTVYTLKKKKPRNYDHTIKAKCVHHPPPYERSNGHRLSILTLTRLYHKRLFQ